MRALAKRLGALETASGMNGGWDYSKPTHSIIKREDQTHLEAVADYRAKHPGKVIGAADNVIWRNIIAPLRDESGAIIARELPKQGLNTGPSLADILAMEAAR